jgi:hypothetical protein
MLFKLCANCAAAQKVSINHVDRLEVQRSAPAFGRADVRLPKASLRNIFAMHNCAPVF